MTQPQTAEEFQAEMNQLYSMMEKTLKAFKNADEETIKKAHERISKQNG